MKKQNSSQILIISFVVILICVLTVAGFFVWNNLNLFGLNSKKTEITTNNSSTDTEGDFVELIAKTISVPSKFKTGVFSTSRTLNLPKDFKISVFAGGMKSPRAMAFDAKNNIYITDSTAGKVWFLPDTNTDGVADDVIEFDNNLKNPHGITFYSGDLYVGETNQVVVYRKINGKGFEKKEVVIKNLPSDGGHSTRTVVIGPDKKIYVSIGSSCNICEEKDARRAAIVRYNLDGSGEEIYASGLRNSVGMIFHNNEIWSVDNGRDLIGDNLPPEEVNVISKKGENYGWPFCYGKGNPNPEYTNKIDYCKNTAYPKFEMQAHSAPLGLSFVENNSWPKALTKDLIVSFHGSWNRTTPTGFKVVRINTESSSEVNFITGWLQADGNAWGRPVDVRFDSKGNFFVADDRAGVVYLVQYQKDCDSGNVCSAS